jgi:hypothetical protein
MKVQLWLIHYFCIQWKMRLMLTIRTLQDAILTKNIVSLYEISVIFWDEFISNDCILMEAVLEEFKTRWDTPHFYVFVFASDCAQACMDFVIQKSIYVHMIQFNPPILSYSVLTDPSNCKSE